MFLTTIAFVNPEPRKTLKLILLGLKKKSPLTEGVAENMEQKCIVLIRKENIQVMGCQSTSTYL